MNKSAGDHCRRHSMGTLAPLTVKGHNFGTEYHGFPWLGILVMCGLCAVKGIFLHWLTQKTGSIYPASIAHSATNNGASSLMMIFVQVNADIHIPLSTSMILFAPILLYLLFIPLLMRNRKKAKR